MNNKFFVSLLLVIGSSVGTLHAQVTLSSSPLVSIPQYEVVGAGVYTSQSSYAVRISGGTKPLKHRMLDPYGPVGESTMPAKPLRDKYRMSEGPGRFQEYSRRTDQGGAVYGTPRDQQLDHLSVTTETKVNVTYPAYYPPPVVQLAPSYTTVVVGPRWGK